jgi:hypothetical protein
MNRIYQGRVSKVEVFGGKDAEGKEQWTLLGFTREKVAQIEQERECLRQLAQIDTSEGIDARQKLSEINRQLNEPWQTALWEHHELFQDAVNYYTFAITALGEDLPNNHPVTVSAFVEDSSRSGNLHFRTGIPR